MANTTTEDIDRLLEKVRRLQTLLPQPESAPKPASELSPIFSVIPAPGCSKKVDDAVRLPSPSICGRNHSEVKTKSREEMKKKVMRETQLSGAEVEESLEFLRHVTFLRVIVDRLTWIRPPAFLAKDFAKNRSPRDKGQLMLEYSFPAGEDSPETLKKRVRAVAKQSLPSVVHFNHRRVALCRVTPALVQLWSRSSLCFRLLYKLPDSFGKNMMKLMGRFQVPLHNLLLMPFNLDIILPFEGVGEFADAKGQVQVNVQLGSRQTAFSDRVERARTERPTSDRPRQPPIDFRHLDPQLLATRLSSADKRPKQNEEQIPGEESPVRPHPPTGYQHLVSIPNLPESPRLLELDRRASTGLVLSNTPPMGNSPRVDMGTQSTDWRSAAVQTDDSSSARHKRTVAERLRRQSREWEDSESTEVYWLRMTIHSAHNLPTVKGPNDGPAVRPSVFVSYRAEEEVLNSSLVRESCHPVWDWATSFPVSHNRKNVVVKLWHRCRERGDRVLGFVSVDLPRTSPRRPLTANFDLVDLSQSSTGTLKITLEPISEPADFRTCDSFHHFGAEAAKTAASGVFGLEKAAESPPSEKGVNTSFAYPQPPTPTIIVCDPLLENASRSFLAERLRTNMNDLEQLLAGMRAGSAHRNAPF